MASRGDFRLAASPFCTSAQAADSSALVGGSQNGWLYVIAAPQYAIAQSGSRRATFVKAVSARAYQKLWRSARLRSKSAATPGAHEMSMCAYPRPAIGRSAAGV